jgi:pimeloyl-ACP methyl ester carboxylesterase
MKLSIRLNAALFSVVLVTASACSAAYRDLRSNALSSGTISNASRNTLRREDLLTMFEDDPVQAIANVRERALANITSTDLLATLAETSFQYAMDNDDRAHFRASAIYAYALLFPDNAEDNLSVTDPRLRIALDAYNSALARGFIGEDGSSVVLAGGEYELPFGILDVDFDEESVLWADSRLVNFIPATELRVKGLRNRYRRWGIGAALAAKALPRDDVEVQADYVPAQLRIPVTALLRIAKPRIQLQGDRIEATLRVYTSTDPEDVQVGQHTVSLEAEPTAALAASLVANAPWRDELKRFMGSMFAGPDTNVRLGALNPMRPGRIPVVFIHGTYSSSSRWANMVNDLLADETIRSRFEFYFFSYDSGNPIAYSGMQLRNELNELYTALESRGGGVADCADHMVLIGHSQGGLLAKLNVVDSGDTFWNSISKKPFEEVEFSQKTRDLLASALFFEAPPFVNRVVFISTPHGGSYLAGSGFARRIAHWLIAIPSDMATLSADALRLRDDPDVYLSGGGRMTSIDNMSPGNRGLKTLAQIQINDGVTAHSIIPVLKDGPLEDAKDGVVAYSSAHIDGVESELIVRSGHSTQDNPHTIKEVQRILLLHSEASRCGSPVRLTGS